MTESTHKEPSLLQALIPIAALVVMLFGSYKLFGSDSSYGPNQIALILCGVVGVLIGLRNGFTWAELEESMVHGISLSMKALFILLVVGSLIGTWILAGVVPTMIYYGLQILHPSIFYFASLVICALVAIATGSSWTTAGTVGIALVGIAGALDLNLGMAAGSIISGAYFGDKLSPLSETTNLAPAMVGTDLFTHIRHMLWTTVPSIVIAAIIFLIIGFTTSRSGQESDLSAIMAALDGSFNLGVYLLIPPGLVLLMAIKKVPAFPALLVGALLGGVFAMIFQQAAVTKFVGAESVNLVGLIKGFWQAMFGGFSADTGNKALDDLLTRGGMASMLNTVWLIMSAMIFGAVMEKTRMLQVVAEKILSFAKNTGSLVVATLCTCMGMNLVASDQYIAIVLPGRMFRAEFENRGLHQKNLSRCLEDAGTLTSPLIPWNSCGAYMSSTLGVPVLSYVMYCFFNMMNPVISAIYGFTGFTIEKLEPAEDEPPAS